MKHKILLHFLAIAIFSSFLSCNNDDDISTAVNVLTEDVVTTSGERAIVTGRILSAVEVAIQDHGFEISTDQTFSAPIVLSLGAKSLPGRFVGEIENLIIRTQYYCRAFMLQGDAKEYGEVIEFSTLSPFVVDFSPKFGTEGTGIVIEGNNLTPDTKVLWGDLVITPEEISFETFVRFKAPAIVDMNFPEVCLLTQGDTLCLDDPFEYIVGLWAIENEYTEETGKSNHFYFRQDDKFVYGLGVATGVFENLNTVHEVDLVTQDTVQMTFPGTAVEGPFYAEGFFGGGSTTRVKQLDLTVDATDAFWKYENQTFTQLADLPEKLYKAACIRLGDKLYVYGGELSDRTRSPSVFEYDIMSDSWSSLGDAPVSPLGSLPAYHLDGMNYFITADSLIYSHNVNADTWQTNGTYEFGIEEYGVSLNLNGTIFIGMHDNSRKMYFYDAANDRWIPKKTPLEINPHFTSGGFVYDDAIYVIRNKEPGGLDRTVWRLDPDAF